MVTAWKIMGYVVALVINYPQNLDVIVIDPPVKQPCNGLDAALFISIADGNNPPITLFAESAQYNVLTNVLTIRPVLVENRIFCDGFEQSQVLMKNKGS